MILFFILEVQVVNVYVSENLPFGIGVALTIKADSRSMMVEIENFMVFSMSD